MFDKFIKSFKAYCEKNENSYKQVNQNWANDEKIIGNSTIHYSITPLPDNLKYKLEENIDGELYILILLNDDITPMEYVIQMLKECLGKSHCHSMYLMLKVHNSGSAQLITGNKTTLEDVAKHIETDARGKKLPIKFSIKRV
jgi:ATP-dependent Clp protease adaptor protein ClpS